MSAIYTIFWAIRFQATRFAHVESRRQDFLFEKEIRAAGAGLALSAKGLRRLHPVTQKLLLVQSCWNVAQLVFQSQGVNSGVNVFQRRPCRFVVDRFVV